MRTLNTLLLASALLCGCDLFEGIEKQDWREADIPEACKDFCSAWVHATYDCLESTDICVEQPQDIETTTDGCREECEEIAWELEESDYDTVSECMWCVVEEVDTEPSCLEFYEDQWSFAFYIAECEWECEDVETMISKFDWPEQALSDCLLDF